MTLRIEEDPAVNLVPPPTAPLPLSPPGSPVLRPPAAPAPAPLLGPLPEKPASPQEEFKRVEPLVSAPLKAGSAYFLINRRWYLEWLHWVGHESVQSPKLRPSSDPLLPDPEVEALMSSAKRTRTQSWTKDPPGQIDNSELLEEGSSTAIKRGLDERSDYELVPEDAWNLLFSWYGGGPPIRRRAIELPSGGVQVELHGLQLKVYKSSDTNGTPLEVTESKCMAVRELKASLCEEMGLDAEKTRIWDYFNNRNYALLEKNADKSLESCRIFDQNPILLEEQNADGTWPYQEGADESGDLGAGSSGVVGGEMCAYSSADVPSVGEPLQRGAVGLQNLGNTCFMNSSIQCLSNIPPLRQFFLTEAYKESLNPMAYKTKGKLAESFAQLLSLMWRQDTRRVAPRNFKYQVGQFAEQFSGYGQQDSMELIEYVLDGLKEDCNLVRGAKPYTEVKEADGRSDEEVASEALEAYRKRSNSLVDDLFVGLFKSVVRCPEPTESCGRESVTFDPFLSAKISLVSSAEQRQTSFSVVVMRDRGVPEGKEPVVQVNVKLSKDQNVKALIEAAAKEVEGLQAESCVLIELWNRKVHQFFEDTAAVESIRPEDVILLCEVANAKAFQVSAEQRWGTAAAPWTADANGSPSAGSLCGVIVHHRQVCTRSWSSYTSRELRGLPMLISVPKATTSRNLCKEVERRLEETVFEAGGPRPSWKVLRVDKWSPTADGTPVDPESDEALELKDSREYFAVEWEETAVLPALLMREEPRPGGVGKQGGEQDLRVLLRMFVEEERLGPDDAWYCNRCKCHKEAWKKLEFHRLPPVLVLQLKRFSYTRWSRERLNTPVSFPLEGLDLAPYCTASSQAGPDPPPTVYDLAALSKHIGSIGGGHYVAYCRSSEDGEWYNFDDGSVCRANAEEVESDKVGAYVLFYVRRDFRPSSFGPPPTPAPSP